MKNEKPDAERVWKQLEDILVPRLALSVVDRAVYSHLLRHSRLEGRRSLRFSITWLSRGARVSVSPTRQAVRRLLEQGVLRLIRRSNAGHTVEVRLPEEIRAAADPSVAAPGGEACDTKMEGIDYMENEAARKAIHARDQGFCFYCLRRLEEEVKTLDHVVPQVHGGAIRTATWCPAARTATATRRNCRLATSCAGCTERAGSRRLNCESGYVHWMRWRQGSCVRGWRDSMVRRLKGARREGVWALTRAKS